MVPRTWSGGYPKILVLDEPSAHLDLHHQGKILGNKKPKQNGGYYELLDLDSLLGLAENVLILSVQDWLSNTRSAANIPEFDSQSFSPAA